VVLRYSFTLLIFTFIAFLFFANTSISAQNFSKQDTLRGSLNVNRNWWDVARYDLKVFVDIENKNLVGENKIAFINTGDLDMQKKIQTMQIDLQEPMLLDSVFIKNKTLNFKKQDGVYLIEIPTSLLQDNFTNKNILIIKYHGSPHVAETPPWDGGLIWKQDELNRPFVSVACQGLGASVWYPCKDHQSEEPDSGASITIICADTLKAVANGKLLKEVKSEQYNNCKEFTWQVANPINSYNLVFYIGKYVHWSETYACLNGNLDCSFYVLDYELEKAKVQFAQTKNMLAAFEFWFGAFPWYADGYKLVQAPHLGMEHQSAIAYGNKFKNGYLGRDLSGTKVGDNWDYILVHESGHEWWGNNITTADIADMWIHEGFTSYSEALFCDFMFGKQAGNTYAQGLRKNISGKDPIVGVYGVQNQPSGDMYPKGANILHTIRTVMDNDTLFRKMLIAIQTNFAKSVVTSKEIEQFISSYSQINFAPFFKQYIYTNEIPVLQYKFRRSAVEVQFVNCNADFELPVMIPIDKDKTQRVIFKANEKQSFNRKISKKDFRKLRNENYYFTWEEL
jgi:aminopeptidase N